MTPEKNKKPHRSIRSYVTSHIKRIDLVTLVPLIVVIDVLTPLLVMEAVDAIITPEAHNNPEKISALYHIVLQVAVALGAIISIQYAARRIFLKRQIKAIAAGIGDIQTSIMNDVVQNAVHLLSVQRIGDITTHIMSDVRDLRDATTEMITEIPFAALTLVGISGVMIWIHPLLTGILGSVGFILSAITVFITKEGLKRRRQEQASFTDSLTQTITSLEEAGTRARIGDAANTTSKAFTELKDNFIASSETDASLSPLVNSFELIGIVILLVYGGWVVLHGELSPGALVAFFAYLEMLSEPLMRMAKIMITTQKFQVAQERLESFWGTFREQSDKKQQSLQHNVQLKGAVTVKNVSFAYPQASKKSLTDISFSALPGEVIAVVGPNGAGKSTLIDLLLKLYEEYAGEIFFDFLESRSIHPQSLRTQIGVVPQELVLLRGSIKDNIVLGSETSSEHLAKTLSVAGVDAIVANLVDGLDTIVGEGAHSFSGGETQRLAIARAYFRDPKILILDEPTSSIDLEGEKEIVQTLRKLCQSRTSFIISHRSAVFEHIPVDKVLLLDKGKQVAFDTPAAVWQNFPQYRLLLPKPAAALLKADQQNIVA